MGHQPTVHQWLWGAAGVPWGRGELRGRQLLHAHGAGALGCAPASAQQLSAAGPSALAPDPRAHALPAWPQGAVAYGGYPQQSYQQGFPAQAGFPAQPNVFYG